MCVCVCVCARARARVCFPFKSISVEATVQFKCVSSFGRRQEANCSVTYQLTDTVYPSVVVILNASFFTSLKLAHKHNLFGLTLYK